MTLISIENTDWIQDGTAITYAQTNNIPKTRSLSFLTEFQGVLVGTDIDNNTYIWTDRYSTLPCYFMQSNDRLFLSNSTEVLLRRGEDLSLDPAGFWEILLFDFPLVGRTSYRGIRQLPSGSRTRISRNMSPSDSQRYWNFAFTSLEYSSHKEIVHEAEVRLKKALQKHLNKDDRVLLPISGGLDSRVLAKLLSGLAVDISISPINFAASMRSLDHIYAKKVCNILDLPAPIFHKLTTESYRLAADEYAKLTGGIISPAHAHLISWLTTQDSSPLRYKLVHGFYSDASCGFACSPNADNSVAALSYLKTLKSAKDLFGIPSNVVEEIISDFYAVEKSWRSGSTITSLKEYLYVAVKHPAFHLALANIYSRYVDVVILPHTDVDVADFFFSIPSDLRVGKRIIRLLLAEPNLRLGKLGDISSFPHTFTPDLRGRLRLLRFRLWRTAALISETLTAGNIIIFNPFDTEHQRQILRNTLRYEIQDTVNFFISQGLFTHYVKSAVWDRKFTSLAFASWGLKTAFEYWDRPYAR